MLTQEPSQALLPRRLTLEQEERPISATGKVRGRRDPNGSERHPASPPGAAAAPLCPTALGQPPGRERCTSEERRPPEGFSV